MRSFERVVLRTDYRHRKKFPKLKVQIQIVKLFEKLVIVDMPNNV
jgi:hypothetical protein